MRYSLNVIDLLDCKCAGDIGKFPERKTLSIVYWPAGNHIFRLWFFLHINPSPENLFSSTAGIPLAAAATLRQTGRDVSECKFLTTAMTSHFYCRPDRLIFFSGALAMSARFKMASSFSNPTKQQLLPNSQFPDTHFSSDLWSLVTPTYPAYWQLC